MPIPVDESDWSDGVTISPMDWIDPFAVAERLWTRMPYRWRGDCDMDECRRLHR